MASDINFFKSSDSLLLKKIRSKRELSSSDDVDGYFIDSDETETRKIIDFLKNSKKKLKIAISAKDDFFNRRVLETMSFDYLVSPEFNQGKNTLKQRSSGLNHVLAKEAAKKNVVVLISLDKIFSLDKFSKAMLIERILQNIKICRKAKCSIRIANFSYTKDLLSCLNRQRLAMSWSMSSQEIRDSCKS